GVGVAIRPANLDGCTRRYHVPAGAGGATRQPPSSADPLRSQPRSALCAPGPRSTQKVRVWPPGAVTRYPLAVGSPVAPPDCVNSTLLSPRTGSIDDIASRHCEESPQA